MLKVNKIFQSDNKLTDEALQACKLLGLEPTELYSRLAYFGLTLVETKKAMTMKREPLIV